jgi:hypothetical protein
VFGPLLQAKSLAKAVVKKYVPFLERIFLQPPIPSFGISELIFEKRRKLIT